MRYVIRVTPEGNYYAADTMNGGKKVTPLRGTPKGTMRDISRLISRNAAEKPPTKEQ